MKFLFALVQLFLFVSSQTLVSKQLAGPPSEFSNHVLPDPSNAAQLQQSALIPMWVDTNDLSNQPQDILWTSPIYIDSTTEFQLAFSSPIASSINLILTDSNGNVVPLGNSFPGSFPIGGADVPETTWAFSNPTVGTYTLTAKSSDSKVTRSSVANDDIPIGFIFTLNLSPITMVAHLNTYNLQQGQEVGVVATIVENTHAIKNRTAFDFKNPKVLKDVIAQAFMEVTLPDGSEQDVEMKDDGLSFDGQANDGIYGGILKATEVGVYKAQAFLQGESNGVQFLRTTQHLIASVADELALSGVATGTMTDSEHLTISLMVDANTLVHGSEQALNTYAEVWGKDSNGNDVAACWIGGMSSITQVNGNNVVNMVLDIKWLSLAGVQTPITLKNVYIQEVSAFVALATADMIKVNMDAFTHAQIVSFDTKITEITREMREGVMPAHIRERAAKADAKSGVVLVHGYCSGTNPWAPYPEDWTDAYYFLNPGASNTNDAFAKLVIAFTEEQGLDRFSIVGHSQGGIVGTHIANFYFTGLDASSNGRKVQSIGTPYKGCSAAGSAANLGEAFGVGCGTNFDLSLDGSSLWEPSITSTTRSDIYYYTTSYVQGNFFGDYCNMAINMILEWPNDGTTEIVYADLNSGNDQGNTEKQCHVTDMAYPAQYYDHSRNKQMNGKAAR